ncbi:MAG: hypothetical protein ACRC9L_05970 [Brevinema sp.]
MVAIAICAMIFAPSVANAAKPIVMEPAAVSQVAAQSNTTIIIIETDDAIIIIIM